MRSSHSSSQLRRVAKPTMFFQHKLLGRRRGLTVLELSVVLCVLTLFAAVAIPLAFRARESAREAKCQDNLRILVNGVNNFEGTFGFYPSNGWGYRWVGEPGLAAGIHQPGSWAYSTLPHIERTSLPMYQFYAQPGASVPSSDLLGQPIPILSCPSRGANVLALNDPNTAPYNARWVPMVFRTDYGCNEGDQHLKTGPGPASLSEEDTYEWPDNRVATGVIFMRSNVRTFQILDGLSNTYFLGEKYVFVNDYLTINSPGHDQCAFTGADLDTNRCTSHPPTWDEVFLGSQPNGGARYFGSAHPNFCWFAFGDGSVRAVSYGVDAEVHRMAGNRADKLALSEIALQ